MNLTLDICLSSFWAVTIWEMFILLQWTWISLLCLCLDGPEMPTIKESTTAWAGHKVKLTCHALSYPPSTYKWFFNNSQVANTSMYITPPLTMNMSGTYTCIAFNNITGQNSSAHKKLTVYGETFVAVFFFYLLVYRQEWWI